MKGVLTVAETYSSIQLGFNGQSEMYCCYLGVNEAVVGSCWKKNRGAIINLILVISISVLKGKTHQKFNEKTDFSFCIII